MSAVAQAQPPAAAMARVAHAILVALVGLGLMAVTVERLWLGEGLPLWLDETWTAIIVRQPTWAAFWREVWLDCNAPFYYLLMHGWQGLAGESNWALRAPSLVFAAAAGALPLLWRPPGLSRMGALTWAGLIWFWWPGLAISLDARAYSLLLLVSVAQTIAFAQLIERPDRRRALIWCALGSLAIFTHYYALYIAAVQGLVYLARHRMDAVKTWPAALLFAPAFAWTAFHLPRLAEYAQPDVAWYPALNWRDVWSCTAYLIGPALPLFAIGVGVVLAAGFAGGFLFGPRQRDEPAARTGALWWALASAVLAYALIMALAYVRPTLTERYLTPLAPPVLLGLVLLAGLGRRAHLTYAALLALFLATAITPGALKYRLGSRALYGFEQPSAFLMGARPTQLVFAWDHPAAKILDTGSLTQLGGFFFERAGQPVETVALRIAPDEDPNLRLLEAATGERPAVLWLYNKARKSAARRHPPRIEAIAPDWTCVHTVDGSRGVVACAPKRLFGS